MNTIDTTKTIKELVDYLLPDLTPYETSLYIYLFRKSILENGQGTIRIGKRTIANNFVRVAKGGKSCFAHITTVLKGLEEKGCIKVGDVNRDGTVYTLILPENIPLVIEKLATVPKISEEDFFNKPEKRQKLFERDKGRCYYCGEEVTKDNATLDHLIPQSKGGVNTKDNLKTSCFLCNSIKSGKTYEEAAPHLLKSISERKRRNDS